MVNFPAPVGGIAYPSDFAPSVVFAGLYVLLLPLVLYRMFNRRSRTVLLIGAATFSIERIVTFVLRALQSRNENLRFSPALVNYMQITFSLGFIGVANDLINILRCVLVNPTYSSAMYYQSPAASTKGGVYSSPPAGTPDRPKLRALCRNVTMLLSLAVLVVGTIPGIIANSHYNQDFDNQKKANQTASLRTVSTVVALALCLVLILLVAWSMFMFRANSKRAAGVIGGVASLMSLVAIYRLAVMRDKITSLAAPISLDQSRSKAAFYIFHVLPEWLGISILFVTNVRKLFGTGPLGDIRMHDMTKKEHAKWEAKQAKKEQKRRAKLGISGDASDAIPLQQNFGSPGIGSGELLCSANTYTPGNTAPNVGPSSVASYNSHQPITSSDVEIGPLIWGQDISEQLRSLIDLLPDVPSINRNVKARLGRPNFAIAHFPTIFDAIQFVNSWHARPPPQYSELLVTHV